MHALRLHHVIILIGAVDKWLEAALDARVQAVSASVNGPLMEMLAATTEYADKSCIACFREGAPILGILPSSGRGMRRQRKQSVNSVDDLATSLYEKNDELLRSRREDANSKTLFAKTELDAEAKRMSQPTPLRRACAS